MPIYIVHTSCIPAHEAIARARALGKRVYGEPLIQHLVLDESEYYNKDWKHAARRVMSPPFRDKLNQDDLWNGLRAGSLQVVATDHCSFTTKQKELGFGDFTKIPNGTGGLEDRMPVLWTYGVETGRLTPNEFVAVTSTNSAKILNMYPPQGPDRPGRRRRHRRLGPQGQQDDLGQDPAIGDRLQRVRGHEGHRAASLYAVARRGGVPRRPGAGGDRPRPFHRPPALPGGRPRAQALQGVHRSPRSRAVGRAMEAASIQKPSDDAGSASPSEAAIEISDVSLRFETRDGPVEALSHVSLKVARGEFVSFIGPSGCGKTTLLRAVADLESPTEGDIRVDGMSAEEARLKRCYGYVFQAPALYPWRTVARNIALPLEIMGYSKAERAARVEKGLKLVNLEGFGAKHPWQLSGGMQQRASIARALSFDPDILLMDEPFGALDEIVRDMLNQQLLQLWEMTGKTVLFVTHSIPEAVFLSTHVVVMSPRPGRITDIIECNFPRDRQLEIRETPGFLAIANRVRHGLRAGHSYDG